MNDTNELLFAIIINNYAARLEEAIAHLAEMLPDDAFDEFKIMDRTYSRIRGADKLYELLSQMKDDAVALRSTCLGKTMNTSELNAILNICDWR